MRGKRERLCCIFLFAVWLAAPASIRPAYGTPIRNGFDLDLYLRNGGTDPGLPIQDPGMWLPHRAGVDPSAPSSIVGGLDLVSGGSNAAKSPAFSPGELAMPEPGTLALMGIALACVGGLRRRLRPPRSLSAEE